MKSFKERVCVCVKFNFEVPSTLKFGTSSLRVRLGYEYTVELSLCSRTFCDSAPSTCPREGDKHLNCPIPFEGPTATSVRELTLPRALPIALAHCKPYLGVPDASRAARLPRLLRLSARESCCKRCKFAAMGFANPPARFLRHSNHVTASDGPRRCDLFLTYLHPPPSFRALTAVRSIPPRKR